MLGGANVLSYAGETRPLDIGARNAAAVQEALEAQKVSVCATELGGKVSRTVRLWVADGRVMMKTLREVEFDGAAIPDHIPSLLGGHRAGAAYSIAYMRALLQAVNNESGGAK